MCRRAGVTIILGVIFGLQTNSTGQKTWAKSVGEVLRRIAGKALMMLFKNDITHAQVLYNYNLVLDRIQELKLLYTLCMIFFPKKTQKPFY